MSGKALNSSRDLIIGIEGLRGVAVLVVIINHLNEKYLPGGYLGVDVFFVISGFVISKSLDGFSLISAKEYLLEFYTRRLRRVFPALFVCVFIITPFSIYIIQGIDKGIIRTGGTSLLGLSNLYQIKLGNDYFGLASKLNVFTHTWSLGVEEQFYIIFPILTFILIKFKKKLILYFSILTIFSIIIFAVLFNIDKPFNYYFPLSRFWELFSGVLTYYFAKKADHLKVGGMNNWRIHLFMGLLLVCFFLPSTFILFVSPAVCLLTALIIYSVNFKNYIPLENAFLTFTGKISYSLYLYHLPIIIIMNLGGDHFADLFTISVIYGVSFISYKFVEAPFRHERSIFGRIKPIAVYVPTAVVTAFLLYIYTNTMGTKDPFSGPIVEGFESCTAEDISIDDTTKCFLKTGSNKQLFFVGDSHSNALLPMMKLLNEKQGYQIHSLIAGGLFTRRIADAESGDMHIKGRIITKYLKKNVNSGDIVILSNQWVSWFSRMNVGTERRMTLDGKRIDPQEAQKIHILDIERFAKTLKNLGVLLIVMAPVPDFKIHPITCYSPLLEKLSKLGIAFSFSKLPWEKCTTTRENQEVRRRGIVTALNGLAGTNIYILDPIDLVCDTLTCSPNKDETPIYYDDDHVNYNFAPYIYIKILKLFLSLGHHLESDPKVVE